MRQKRFLYLGKFLPMLTVMFILVLATPGLAQKRDYSAGSLTWDDFKGDVPSDTEFDAAVAGDIELENPTENANSSGGDKGVPSNDCIVCSHCKPRKAGHKLFKIKNTKKCKVKVKAVIDQGRSWSKPDKQTPELLAHEQGHMDLWVAAAKAAEKEINSMEKCIAATNCGFEAKNAFRAVINTVMQENRDKGQKLQEKYDEETDHGRKKEEQEKWLKKIKELLAIKGGPSWDDINTIGSTGDKGGKGVVPDEGGFPQVALNFPEISFENVPWAEGPVTMVLPALTFENQGSFSRLWALDGPATIDIYDADFNLMATASIDAFFGNESDTVFTAFLHGPLGLPSLSEVPEFPIEQPDSLSDIDPPLSDEDQPIFSQLTLKVGSAFGELLASLGPFETFNVGFEIGQAPPEPEAADVNYDGRVDENDIAALQRALDGQEVLILPQTGDLNSDSRVDQADLEALIALVNGRATPTGIQN